MKTAVFANSKGGVGKSTIALLTSLSLATRYNRAKVELIDLLTLKLQLVIRYHVLQIIASML